MEKEFDINNIGKRMPYTVPDDFFANVEDKVMERVGNLNNSKKRKGIVIALRAVIAAAACVALLFVVKGKFFNVSPTPADDFASVQLAFNNLSSDDQDFLIEVYEDDDILYNEE
jgi:hypothetical protein